MERTKLGKWLISVVSGSTVVGPFLADWNRTHVYNPQWPPHAKFHEGQTIILGVLLGGLSLGFLWLRPERKSSVQLSTLFGSLYWVALIGSTMTPGAATVDPEFADKVPHVDGLPLNEVVLAAMNLGLLGAGYVMESRRVDPLEVR